MRFCVLRSVVGVFGRAEEEDGTGFCTSPRFRKEFLGTLPFLGIIWLIKWRVEASFVFQSILNYEIIAF